LITCPNCGNAVRETQQFCGNCGTDVHAALAAQAAPPITEQPSQYAYPQTPSYGYEYPQQYPQQPAQPSPSGRIVVIAVIGIVALCCAFFCGLVFGFEIIPDLLGIGSVPAPAPTPRPSPTPSSLLPIIHYLIG
jgi:hypothetical protein